MAIEIDDLQSASDEEEYRRLKKYALWRLAKQNYHSQQLKNLLLRRSGQVPMIDGLILELKQSGILNDEAWIEVFIRSQSKRYGPSRLGLKLRQIGLDQETVQIIQERSENAGEQKEAILNLLHTTYRNRDLSDRKNRSKVIASLMRKGFHYEEIRQAFGSLETI